VRASIVIHKKNILANKWRIGNHMRFYTFQDVPIICFKIKNPPPVELCWQKKRNP
jgi:hypothetical protein